MNKNEERQREYHRVPYAFSVLYLSVAMTDPPGTDHPPVVVALLSLLRELWRLRFLGHHATSMEVFSRLRAFKAKVVEAAAAAAEEETAAEE